MKEIKDKLYTYIYICEKNIYVGQTGDKFYQRMLLNFSKIRTQKPLR